MPNSSTALFLPLSLLLLAAAPPVREAQDSLVPPTFEERGPRPTDPPPFPAQLDERPAIHADNLDLWQKRIGKAEAALGAADFAEVLRRTGDLQADMLRYSRDPQQRLPGLVARTFLLRALAEIATDQEVDALFDLHAACAIDAGLGQVELAAYGAPGRDLAAAAAREEQEIERNLADGRPDTQLPKQRLAVRRNEIDRLDRPLPEPLAVRAVIDLEGQVRQPTTLETLHPLAALAVLNSVREARFEPARIGDRPVMIHYLLRLDG